MKQFILCLCYCGILILSGCANNIQLASQITSNVPSSVTEPTEPITDIPSSVTEPTEPITDIPSSVTEPTEPITDIPSSVTEPTEPITDIPSSVTEPTEPITDIPSSVTEPTEPITDFPNSNTEGDPLLENYCILIVNGTELSGTYYVYYYENTLDVEIPLIAVAKELGATVEWKNNTIISFTYNDEEYLLDISEPSFGLPQPPGSTHYCRKITENDIIVDDTSVSGIIRWLGGRITFNSKDNVIEIKKI